MDICRSLCHSFFNFVNLRFVAKVTFFPNNFYKKIYFHGKIITEFYFFFYFHMCSLEWLNSFFTENNFLPHLIEQESYSSPHCIFQSVYTLNTSTTKILRRSVVRVLITLLIKQ